MEDKEKVDSLIELCKIQMDHFEKTRNIEFRVNIALWTLIVLAGKFGYGKIHLNDSCSKLFYFGFVFIVIIFHYIWMKMIQWSQDKDHELTREYKLAILKIFKLPDTDKEKELFSELLKNLQQKIRRPFSWIFCEVVITLVLLVALGIVLSLKPFCP